MSIKIFFSYRSSEGVIAERIFERLVANYSAENVHKDVRPLAHGNHDLREYVNEFLKPYNVFLVLIGPTWIESRGGMRRLDDPQDIVRVELATALELGIPCIPILVRGADMPTLTALPDEIKPLAEKESVRFGSDKTFRGDMMRLHHRLAAIVIQRESQQSTSERIETPPTTARKDQLNEFAKHHSDAHNPPFSGVRIETLGEVLWILGAQHGELGARYGERRFEPDLSAADLSGLNLSDADLRNAKLVDTRLDHVNLSGSNLSEANLSKASLQHTNLARARLTRATLTAKCLDYADLTECNLDGANLSGADLTYAVITGARLEDARLHKAVLTGQRFLPGAQLKRADLSEADLSDATLRNVQLEDAHLDHARLNGADISKSNLVGADLSAASMGMTDLSAVDLTGASIDSVAALRGAIIDGRTKLETVKWQGRPFADPRTSKTPDERLRAYRERAEAYHELADMLRNKGLVAEASVYRLKEQQMRRGLLWGTKHFGAWLISTLLNLIAGYGERIGRTLSIYVVLIFGFAGAYWLGANFFHLESTSMTVGNALIESFIAFHGRGFVVTTLQPGDPMAGVTVAEAVCGLFIEAIFIATFSRRFLSQ